MSDGLSISGIGYPMMGLGNYGLGMTSGYGSYDSYMPSMLGMNNSMLGSSAYGGYGNYGGMMGMMGMNPMMSMYYPTFMAEQQNQVEQMQLSHAGDMHTQLLKNQVNAHRETDSALINTILTNSSVTQKLKRLHDKIVEGDQDAICSQYDELKECVYTTYQDELKARGVKDNPAISANEIIERIYSQMFSTDGETVTLENDIKQYGEGALENGFRTGFRTGHQKRYVDQTLNHCLGLEIDEKGAKDNKRAAAQWVGRGASVAERAVIGAAVGAGAYVAGGGIVSVIKKAFGGKMLEFSTKHLSRTAIIAAGIGAVGDILWQLYDNKETA